MNARDIAYGYAIGYNDGVGGELSDDWQPPDWWIPVPEPGEYDIYILLQAQPTGNNNAKMKIAFSLYKESTSYPGAWVNGDNIYCIFGTNCFQNCYSLYPRPDGSIN